MSDEGSATSYVRAVEAHWRQLAQRPVVLSPRDWIHLTRWHERRVPLELIREAMDEAAARRGGDEPFRSLSAIARAVEEGFRAILDGRLAADAPPAAPPAGQAPTEIWRDTLSRLDAQSSLARCVAGLLERCDAGEPREILDRELDGSLPGLAPPAELERARARLEAQVRPFRSRIGAREIEAVLQRGLVERLRGELGLPRLAPGEGAT